MATAPLYAPLPFYAFAQLTAANAFLNGGGTIVSLKTASTSGSAFSRLDRLRIVAIGDTQVGAIRFFIKRGSGGTWQFFREIPVAARTLANGDAPWEYDLDCTQTQEILYLLGASPDQLGLSTKIANTFNVHAFGGDT